MKFWRFISHWLFRPHFLAGSRAEVLFLRQARSKGWILEKIEQSKESMEPYRKLTPLSLKRGDFICRNCYNVEIEVKCLRVRENVEEENYFLLPYRDWKRHQNLSQVLGVDDVVFAIYERDGRRPKHNSLRMVSARFLKRSDDYLEGKLYHQKIKCLAIPVKYTRPGLEVLRLVKHKKDQEFTSQMGYAPSPFPSKRGIVI